MKMQIEKQTIWSRILDIRELSLLILILLSSITLSLATPYFLTINNVLIIFNGLALDMIIATGMTISLIGGLIDFSVGSILGCAGFISARLLSLNVPVFICILAGIFSGILLGLLNGIIINKLKVLPIVATIGTWMAFKGLGILIIGGASIANFPKIFKNISQSWNLFGVPFNIVVMVVIVAVGIFLLKKVNFFHQAYFVGGNAESAKLAGINISKFTLAMYAINGLLAAIAGILMISRLGSAPATLGQGTEFRIVTALLIGGISFNGGEGSIYGAFLGALLMSIITNVLALFSLSADVQLLIIGFVLIFAVALDEYNRRRKAIKSS
jgi:ribose/xylose/arabinose/galactoside ABC-type transport system permease subunit